MKKMREMEKLFETRVLPFPLCLYFIDKLSFIFTTSELFLSTNYGTVYPIPNKPWFLRVCSTSLLKTLLEKEQLLVTSNFSISHSVF